MRPLRVLGCRRRFARRPTEFGLGHLALPGNCHPGPRPRGGSASSEGAETRSGAPPTAIAPVAAAPAPSAGDEDRQLGRKDSRHQDGQGFRDVGFGQGLQQAHTPENWATAFRSSMAAANALKSGSMSSIGHLSPIAL